MVQDVGTTFFLYYTHIKCRIIRPILHVQLNVIQILTAKQIIELQYQPNPDNGNLYI